MQTLQALKFLFVAPAILLMLAVINYMTAPGDWWIQWPALGLGIAWFICLFRVLRTVLLLGGLAAFGTWLYRQRSS